MDEFSPFVAISNDGRNIIYLQPNLSHLGEEHKNVTCYLDGKLVQSYSTEEFIDCDKNSEKCELFYENQYKVYKLRGGTVNEYKNDISEKEKFLVRNFVFNKNDTIYVIDVRKKVLLYDLNKQEFIKRKIEFDSIYPEIKNFEAVKKNIYYYNYPYKYINDIEDSVNGKKLSASISEISNLKFISLSDSSSFKFKEYRIELRGYLSRDGKFDIESIYTDKIFEKNKIIDFILKSTFKTDFIPREVDKIYLTSFYGGFRNFDDKIALQETIKANELKKLEYQQRLTQAKIDDVYIPKDLYECLIELDKTLNFESKSKLKEAKNIWQFNSHMGGLGMWIRNNWGINGGSRLSKYFYDRKLNLNYVDNDKISGIIIEEYTKWLREIKVHGKNGKRNIL